MAKKKITIEVPEEIAEAYEKASRSDRQRAERALSYSLVPKVKAAEELKKILDRTGRTAKERGLTQEKLQELLDD